MSACNVADLHQGVRNRWEVRAGEVVVGDRGERDPGEGLDGRVGEEEEKAGGEPPQSCRWKLGSSAWDCSESVPHDAPEPKGSPVLLTTFIR